MGRRELSQELEGMLGQGDEYQLGVGQWEPGMLAWRIGQFDLLGFDETSSNALARSKADVAAVKDTLDRGCPHHLAVEIHE